MTAGSDDRHVRIYEVGPRDGLQNESTPISTADKLRFVELLAHAGLRETEVTSSVSTKDIPQPADAEGAGAYAISDYTAATDEFTTHNIDMTVEESLSAFALVLARAAEPGWWRRAYVSTAFGCPYTGRVEPQAAVDVARRLLDLEAA